MKLVLFFLIIIWIIWILISFNFNNKKIKPIKFSDEFYENLKYFKLENFRVIAIKKDNTKEVLIEGPTKNIEKYFERIQLGFEEWLKQNQANNFQKSENNGIIKFE